VIKRTVKLLIALGFLGVEKIFAFFRNAHEKPGTCVVLMYHDVTAANCLRFVRQMEILPQLATPVATDAIGELRKNNHHVAVTFDDGFASTIQLVLPILTCKAIPATFFIPAAELGKDAIWITARDRSERVGPIITADSLKLISKQELVTIASHGMHHRRITEMNDQEAQEELTKSKTLLEDLAGKKVKMHSFPYGSYEDRHVAMAQKAGYEHVFTVDPTVTTGAGEPFVIGRVEVGPSDWSLEFLMKVLGAYRWHPHVSRLKKYLSTMLWQR